MRILFCNIAWMDYYKGIIPGKDEPRGLIGLGVSEWVACEGAYSRKAYWRMAGSGVVQRALTKERLINRGFYDLATSYQSLHVNY